MPVAVESPDVDTSPGWGVGLMVSIRCCSTNGLQSPGGRSRRVRAMAADTGRAPAFALEIWFEATTASAEFATATALPAAARDDWALDPLTEAAPAVLVRGDALLALDGDPPAETLPLL